MQLTMKRDKYERVTISKMDGDTLIAKVSEKFIKQEHFATAARQLDVPRNDLMQWVDSFQRGHEDWKQISLTPPVEQFDVLLRGKRQVAAQGVITHDATPLTAFKMALGVGTTEPEPILTWTGTDRLAALDIDWHGIPTLSDEQLRSIIHKVQPRPFAAWITHGKGIRCMYHATDQFAADELAAVAAISIKQQPGTALAGVEVKNITRHPGYRRGDETCSEILWFTQSSDMDALAEMLGQRVCEEDEITLWLAERGMEIGRRYDHYMCPARPDEPSHNQPVIVHDQAIYCASCNGRGIALGHKVPGYFPFTVLIGRQLPHQFRVCLDNFTHWAHARFLVVDTVQMPEEVAKHAYSAALKMRHGNDPRLPAVFTSGQNFVRFDNRWASEKGQALTSNVAPILAKLPACQYVTQDGALAIDNERLAWLDQPVDLSVYGYPAISPVWGFRVYGCRLPYRDPTKAPITIYNPLLAPPVMEMFRPTYIPSTLRKMTEEQAWQTLETVFPGVNRNAVKLLIAAKGVAEGEVGLPPMIYLYGPSGSSKTAIVMIAAAICGDGHHAVQWTNNIERVRQSLFEAKERGSFAVFNEIIKEMKKTGKGDGAFDFILNLTSDSLSHKMYIGPVPLGSLPVMCFTDTQLPASIVQNTQLARRVVGVHLLRRLDWEQSIKDNFGKLEYLRTSNPLFADACNIILSCVVDAYFSKPMTFEEIAELLGFSRLEKNEAVDEKEWALLNLFRHVAAAPDAEGAYASRWSGRGWKVIKRSDRTELSDAWAAIADAEWFTSEQSSEADWASLLGVDKPIKYDTRRASSVVAIRFVSGNKVNGEITDGEVELAARPAESGSHRLGDTERSEPTQGGRDSVPERQYDPSPMSSGEAR